jgi:hypothetical protein
MRSIPYLNFEIRISKPETNSKFKLQNSNLLFGIFEFRTFVLVSNFGFRVSNLFAHFFFFLSGIREEERRAKFLDSKGFDDILSFF